MPVILKQPITVGEIVGATICVIDGNTAMQIPITNDFIEEIEGGDFCVMFPGDSNSMFEYFGVQSVNDGLVSYPCLTLGTTFACRGADLPDSIYIILNTK